MRLGHGVPVHCAATLALLIAGILVSACSTNIDEPRTPSPDVPSAHMPYPGVHDMPPARSNSTLNVTEQQQAQKDMLSARDAVTNRAGQKKPSSAEDAPNKKPVKPDRPTTQAAGGDRNP